MARFTTRVELHDAKTWADYDKLHAAMRKQGFTQTIETKGKITHLPSAEYNRIGTLTKEQVLESAKGAAASTGHKFSVLVTESSGRTWYNLPEE